MRGRGGGALGLNAGPLLILGRLLGAGAPPPPPPAPGKPPLVPNLSASKLC